MMKEVVDGCGLKRIVYHEIRGLSATLYKHFYPESEVQALMTHESINTTRGYFEEEDLPFDEITIAHDIAPWESNV